MDIVDAEFERIPGRKVVSLEGAQVEVEAVEKAGAREWGDGKGCKEIEAAQQYAVLYNAMRRRERDAFVNGNRRPAGI